MPLANCRGCTALYWLANCCVLLCTVVYCCYVPSQIVTRTIPGILRLLYFWLLWCIEISLAPAAIRGILLVDAYDVRYCTDVLLALVCTTAAAVVLHYCSATAAAAAVVGVGRRSKIFYERDLLFLQLSRGLLAFLFCLVIAFTSHSQLRAHQCHARATQVFTFYVYFVYDLVLFDKPWA